MKQKRILFIIAIAIPLLSTKCAEKTFYLTVKNRTNFDIAMTSSKDTAALREMYERGTFFQSEFNLVKQNETSTIPFIKSDLYFYFSKNKKSYIFYFLKYSIKDTFNNKILFDKKYDSIILPIDEINTGEEKNNIFIYNSRKISFDNK